MAMRVEKIDKGFLDTLLTSFGSTRKLIWFGLRVAKRIEKADKGFSQNEFCCIYKTNISSCEAKKSTSTSDHNTNKSLTYKTLKQKMSG